MSGGRRLGVGLLSGLPSCLYGSVRIPWRRSRLPLESNHDFRYHRNCFALPLFLRDSPTHIDPSSRHFSFPRRPHDDRCSLGRALPLPHQGRGLPRRCQSCERDGNHGQGTLAFRGLCEGQSRNGIDRRGRRVSRSIRRRRKSFVPLAHFPPPLPPPSGAIDLSPQFLTNQSTLRNTPARPSP